MGEEIRNPRINNNINPISINSNGRNGSQAGVSAPLSASELQAVIDTSVQKASLTKGDVLDVVHALFLLRNIGDPNLPNSPFMTAVFKLALLPQEDKTLIKGAYNQISNATLGIPDEQTAAQKLPGPILNQLFNKTPVENLLENLKNSNTSKLKQGLVLQELVKRQQKPDALTPQQNQQLSEILNTLKPVDTNPPKIQASAAPTAEQLLAQREALALTGEQRINIPRHIERYATRDANVLLDNLFAKPDPSESANKALNRQVYSLNELTQRAAKGELLPEQLGRLEQAKQALQQKDSASLKLFKDRFNVIRLFNAPAQARGYDEAQGVKPPVAPPVILAEIDGEQYSQNLVEALKISRPRPGETPEQQALRKAIILNEVAQSVQDKRTEPENLENAKAALKALPPEQAAAIQQNLVATFPNSALAKEFGTSVVNPQAGLPTANQTKTASSTNPNVLPNLQIIFSRLSNKQLFSNLTTRSDEQTNATTIQRIVDGHAYALNELTQRVRSPKGLPPEDQAQLQSILYNMSPVDRDRLLARFQDFNTGLNSLAEVINPTEFPIKPGNSTASVSTAPSEIKTSTSNTASKPVETTPDPAAEAARKKAMLAKRKARTAYVNNTANQLAEQLIEKDSVTLASREAENKLNAMNMTATEKQKALQIVQAKMQRANEVKEAATQWADDQIQKNAITSMTAPAQIHEAMTKAGLSPTERVQVSKFVTERVAAHEQAQQQLAQASAEQQKKNQELEKIALNDRINQTPREGSGNNRFF